MSTLPTENSPRHQKKNLLASVKLVDARCQTGPLTQPHAPGSVIASCYTDMRVPTEDLYALLPSQPDFEVQLRTSSDNPKKKLLYNVGEKDDFRFEQTNTRSDARFNICRHGDIITSKKGFGPHQLRLICSTEAGKPGFAYLTGIGDIDDRLRDLGYFATAQDALEEAYKLIAKDKPELALAKCSRKRTRDAKSDDGHCRKARRVNASRRVPFIHPEEDKTEWLSVPHSHEISFNNQTVVFQETFRGLDPLKAVIRLSEEAERLDWDEDSETAAYTMFASVLNVPLKKLFCLRDFFKCDFDPLVAEDNPEDSSPLNAEKGANVALPCDSTLPCCFQDCPFCENVDAQGILLEYEDPENLIGVNSAIEDKQ